MISLNVNRESLLCFLFLVPIYFCYFSFDAVGVSFPTYLQYITYPVIGLFCKRKQILALICLAVFLYSFNYLKLMCGGGGEYFIDTTKMVLYGGAFIITAYQATFSSFYKVFEVLTKYSIFVILASAVFFYMTGLEVFVDGGYGETRFHATFTEPSAAAIPLAIFFGTKVYERNLKWVVLAVLAVALTQSLIAAILLSVTLVVLLSLRSIGLSFSLLLAGSLFYAMAVGLSVENISFIRGVDERLYSGVLSIITFGEMGYNPRVITTNAVVELLIEYNSLVTGLGVEVNSCVTSALKWSYDSNLVVFLIRSFGLGGAALYFIIFIYILVRRFAICRSRDENFVLLLFVIISTAGVVINGAQGILYFAFNAYVLCKAFIGKELSFKPSFSAK